ncbi:malonate--CoA ligase [Alcaligenes endophyticus]|uniref:Malonyl-CoA synthase n=1 Tax=Alcaligenes endophyticus TaxID=1929088 RepID=A0ABT8EHB6_9BURK|nr:malonyl-CoA synthase [Alcaligenes endophyticus]MCX5589657.1 malonyl-CoA synthase [Alcaligenes endophyticus]MDN4120679.1 malonyl-CoA synthase [Alcaligenes endophyticus]
MSLQNANLYAILSQGFAADRGAVAIHTPTRDYSWDDLEHTSARIAHLLTDLALQPGARVAVQVEKSPEALMLYLACLRAGYVYLPLNTAYTAAELAYFLKDAEPELVVLDPARVEAMQATLKEAQIAHVLTLDAQGQGSVMEQSASKSQQFTTVQSQADDLAAILYTSGTTGRSKGAMLSHENLSSNAIVLKEFWGWQSDDVLLHMLPIFHVHGLFVASHGALLAGARMIWLPRLDIEQALKYLPQSTVMMGVPTYYVRLLNEPRFTRETCASMRLFISGSAPLLLDTFQQFTERTGHTILERYGMSETVMLTSNPYLSDQGPRVGGTVGVPLPDVEVRIMNDEGEILSQLEQIGHVQVRGPNVFAEYWRMPEKTREEFTGDGWFRTGDMGKWTDVGATQPYLSIVGRGKDLIISGGFNVYPKELELLIDTFEGVNESAVIGVPHKDFGEAVVAVVVPHEGVTLDVAALQALLKSNMANYKQPKQIHIVESLPRNTMGKVQKNVLREQYA